jgi:hypothetical protein
MYMKVLGTLNFVHIEPVQMPSSLKVIEMLQSSNVIQHVPCAAIPALISCAGNAFLVLAMQTGTGRVLKGKCALGPFLSILVIECQHKCFNVNS